MIPTISFLLCTASFFCWNSSLVLSYFFPSLTHNCSWFPHFLNLIPIFCNSKIINICTQKCSTLSSMVPQFQPPSLLSLTHTPLPFSLLWGWASPNDVVGCWVLDQSHYLSKVLGWTCRLIHCWMHTTKNKSVTSEGTQPLILWTMLLWTHIPVQVHFRHLLSHFKWKLDLLMLSLFKIANFALNVMQLWIFAIPSKRKQHSHLISFPVVLRNDRLFPFHGLLSLFLTECLVSSPPFASAGNFLILNFPCANLLCLPHQWHFILQST